MLVSNLYLVFGYLNYCHYIPTKSFLSHICTWQTLNSYQDNISLHPQFIHHLQYSNLIIHKMTSSISFFTLFDFISYSLTHYSHVFSLSLVFCFSSVETCLLLFTSCPILLCPLFYHLPSSLEFLNPPLLYIKNTSTHCIIC